ncbi:nucleoporin NUP42 [Orycteropus afer afer]|uniref:Nucleoporin NUP42 n=1 Tax=Orycteropus afer afer TaxID=1230840 RepID=A0A8B7A9U5_ORYAF|nr:nucleoporin NUP42 [Orycteropus afer afer]
MAICQFFLQGRCRFGDRCWNEHPSTRGASGGRQQPQHQPSGINRRGWDATNQRYSSVIQPSSFSTSTPRGAPGHQEGTVKDMEVWESSGQWMFSVYSPMKNKPNISGFTDISPEELRLQYHNFLTSNNLQSYLNSVQQLINQWRNRVNELKTLTTSTKITLLSGIKDRGNQAAPALGFGCGQAPTVGSAGFPVNNNSQDNAQNFSFKPSSGFVMASSGNPSVFGSPPAFGAAPSANSAITACAPAFGFGKPGIISPTSFSFKSSAASGFGSPGFSAFPASLAGGPVGAPAATGFGSSGSVASFGSPGSQSNTAFSKPSNNMFGNRNIATSLPVPNGCITTDNILFTPRDQLTAEELEQFQCRKFTLGKIPLKPPPVELLNI